MRVRLRQLRRLSAGDIICAEQVAEAAEQRAGCGIQRNAAARNHHRRAALDARRARKRPRRLADDDFTVRRCLGIGHHRQRRAVGGLHRRQN